MNPNSFKHIKSSKFPILPGEEDELVNAGTYGKALALYIESELKKKSYAVPFICCEDWGWWVEIACQPFSLGVCVYSSAYLINENELCVAVGQTPGRTWSWKKFKMVDKADRGNSLFNDLCKIFNADKDIQVIGYPTDFPLA
jgi:hypothetical protein